jgi:AraC-like DNA-binding protein
MSSAICIQFKENFIEKLLSGISELHVINEFLFKAKRGIQFVNRTHSILIKQIERLPYLIGMKRLLGLLTILDIKSTSNDFEYLSSPNYKPIIINSLDKERMETNFQYVIQNYSNKIFLEDKASHVNLTPHSFCRYFKSRTTKVFSSFVNEVRIGNACKNLIENKYIISQICFQSGFNYLSNFNWQFKKLKGITPSEFQKKYKSHNFDLTFDK